jgi:hypothetical protein
MENDMTNDMQTASASTHEALPDALKYTIGNAITSAQIDVEIDSQITAGSAGAAFAERMGMPSEVSWALRDERSSRLLDDTRPLADQAERGSRLSIVPRTHLGAASTPSQQEA